VTVRLGPPAARRLAFIATTIVVLAGVWAWRTSGLRPSPPAGSASGLEAAIADVEAGRRTTPLVAQPAAGGDATVTFLVRGADAVTPRIVSDVTGWGESVDGSFDFQAGTMRRVGTTGWYSLEATVAHGARIEYLVAYGRTDYRIDPHNPRRAAGSALGGADASEFVTGGYQPPTAFVDPPAVPAGTLREHSFESRALRRQYTVVVYTPAGYRADRTYPVAVFTDSGPRQMPRVLDWLVASGSIEPILMAFVAPASPGHDVRTGAPLQAFLAGEVPRWLASRYPVAPDPGRWAVLGISFGARDALEAAVAPGGAYGCVGLLIPGRRVTAADIGTFAARRARGLRVAILAGRYDRSNRPTALALRDALGAAGHRVDYIEVPEGHGPATFHHHLDAVLASLFGGPRPR
jgi:enterochelin esterase-like enzyme